MPRPSETIHSSRVRRRRLILLLGGTLLLVGFLVYVFVFSRHGILRLRDLEEENTRLEGELSRVQRENAALKEDLRRLDDPEVAEKIAREELGLVKEGDVVYRFIEPPTDGKAPAPNAP